MIHGISANQPSFHNIEFTTGLNIILAERTDTSTQKDTRNGLGKSTLIDIINFCLGSRAVKGKGLCIDVLKEWSFTLDITLSGNRVKVTRSISEPNLFIIDGLTPNWIEQPDLDPETGKFFFSWERWKVFLGCALFALPRVDDVNKYKPSYRSLISYFIRQGSSAYTDDPFRHARQQSPWDIQVNVGFLLGLNWEYASRWQQLKDQEKSIKAINEAIKSGVINSYLGSIGELEAERVELEEKAKREEEALVSFKVHPQYEAIQEEANRFTSEIHELINQTLKEKRRLLRYRESITVEAPPSSVALEELYGETGLVFPDSVQKTLDEARQFHQSIIKNRTSFLQTEIERLERQIEKHDEKVKELTVKRASSLDILSSYGALQEMTKLQERNIKTKEQLNRIQVRIAEMKDLTSRKREIKVSKAELEKFAEQDHEQRRSTWSTAVRLFNDNCHALYKTPGRLVIDITEAGYKYDVEIERNGSEGIGRMKLFCFDLTLLHFSTIQKRKIDFLVHDSTLFDGVDSRQRAFALERAASVSEDIGVQYICTLNSDMIPRDDFSQGFIFNRYVRHILTDQDPSGRLLGFQFEKSTEENSDTESDS